MTKQADAVKIYKRRDSATAVLRKMGIKSSDYASFIEKMGDGRFACQIARAEMHLNPQTSTKITISSLCRSMILDGKTNEEILTALREEFGEERIGPEKRSYPCWYRCELRRKGELPPAFETSTQLNSNAIHRFED